MSGLLFPQLTPRVADPIWFNVDKPCDDETELSKLEEEHQTWLQSIADKDKTLLPIGKTSEQQDEDEDEEDDDDGDDDEESDSTNDDELDTDMIGDSPDEGDMDTNDANVDSPPWGIWANGEQWWADYHEQVDRSGTKCLLSDARQLTTVRRLTNARRFRRRPKNRQLFQKYSFSEQ